MATGERQWAVQLAPALGYGAAAISRVWPFVDGDIVDLNRIPLPPDTPIIDERFKDGSAK
jgi:hypothetical protein